MKAKLEILLREGHLANLPDFELLHKNYLSKAEKFKKGKVAAERARQKLDEKMAQGRMDLMFTFEPKTAFLVAKYRKKIAKAELELDSRRLETWLEIFLKNPDRAELVKYLDKKLKEDRAKSDKAGDEKSEKAENKPHKPTKKLTQKPEKGERKNPKKLPKKATSSPAESEKTGKVSKK